jgi:NAD(P)-dependent dehydrogenase (short-subunit alcohol dehydrogenase family)
MPSSNSHAVRYALVTGAATGIGEGLVVRLQQEGWHVFAVYRQRTPDNTRWNTLPNVTPISCDVTAPDQIGALVAAVTATSGGRLDLLINNAAYASNAGVIEAADMQDYRRTFEVNFWGPMQMAQALMPLLRKARGRILNTTSASVYLTIPMGSAYPVSKSALKSLTRHLRMEMAPFGVEVTNLEPGGVATPMTAFNELASDSQWQVVPEHLREQYRQHFVDGATAVGNNFKFYTPDVFAGRVYREVIMAKRLKPYYLIGPGVGPLPWLHRLMPVQQVENIWAKMFGVKGKK